MSKKFLNCGYLLLGILLFIYAPTSGQGQVANDKTTDSLKQAIDKDPGNPDLHAAYIKASGFYQSATEEVPALIAQFKEWMKEFPTVATIPYALGHAYAGKESPKARTYLLEALRIDPNFDKAYFDLWMDADRWGDFKKSREYISRASELQPDNPDYAFYYAMTFQNDDPAKYIGASLDIVNRFPKSERGAQALYWLGVRINNTAQRTKYFEMLRTKYPPSKFDWSRSGMSYYFELLLSQSPEKAVSLSEEMLKNGGDETDLKEWKNNLEIAEKFNKAKELMLQNKNQEALAALNSIQLSRWSRAKNTLLLQKAKVLNALGETNEAYDQLKLSYASEPVPEIGIALNKYGKALGKNEDQINKDVWFVRDTAAKAATPFTLKQYLKPGTSSLSDLKGKVVLLTYWFPGCGPCRGEFPHFQNVVNKFDKEDLAYIGINIVPGQNEYVIPFMKSSGYTFLPLEDMEGRDKGNLDNRNAAPVNFLIDKEGRIIYKNFRTDGSNEDVLENMIRSLVQRG